MIAGTRPNRGLIGSSNYHAKLQSPFPDQTLLIIVCVVLPLVSNPTPSHREGMVNTSQAGRDSRWRSETICIGTICGQCCIQKKLVRWNRVLFLPLKDECVVESNIYTPFSQQRDARPLCKNDIFGMFSVPVVYYSYKLVKLQWRILDKTPHF